MSAPVGPDRCPRCGVESPCTDWQEVDIGVGTQTWGYEFTCPTHGPYGYVDRGDPPVGVSREALQAWWRAPLEVIFREDE